MGQDPSDRKSHWESIYASRPPEALSWHQADPAPSIQMIRQAMPELEAPIIDVGGGASRLADALLAEGYRDLTVLDISATALAQARLRLGPAAAAITWIEADVTRFRPQRRYRLWHDRAVFHFLTDAEDRRRYVAALDAALEPDGQLIIASFAIGGPERCSGLEIVQYDAPMLSAALGDAYVLTAQQDLIHRTPAGSEQAFSFFRWRRRN
ncbi:MAG: class I SAM-dependent methyltransferase [Chloroflexi bacterium]|nr:class I SAM-dependent methyltransferase [Chloroflexota bacterium]